MTRLSLWESESRGEREREGLVFLRACLFRSVEKSREEKENSRRRRRRTQPWRDRQPRTLKLSFTLSALLMPPHLPTSRSLSPSLSISSVLSQSRDFDPTFFHSYSDHRSLRGLRCIHSLYSGTLRSLSFLCAWFDRLWWLKHYLCKWKWNFGGAFVNVCGLCSSGGFCWPLEMGIVDHNIFWYQVSIIFHLSIEDRLVLRCGIVWDFCGFKMKRL